jgi:hypothetical protein
MKAGAINILAVDNKGQPQVHLTPEPAMNKADVLNRYVLH